MKKILLGSAFLFLLGTGVFAQIESNTPHFGIKAGFNYSTFGLGGIIPTNYDNGWKTGPVGGFFGNIPLGKRFAIQPELLYSVMGGTIRRGSLYGDINQRLNYLSIPVMLKYYLGNDLRIMAGLQADALLSSKKSVDGVGTNNIDDLNRENFAWTAGAEYWPVWHFGLGARYIGGLNDINGGFNPTLKNQGIQVYLSYRFGKKPVPYVAPPPPPPAPSDRDNDGIIDANDKCPDVPGLAKYDGCPIPDTDKDGINDENDKCPTVPGLAQFQGCPDTDNDGIPDSEDKCPTVAGLARYNGCPIPDTDGDGINDEEDRCPTVAGVLEMKGCPKIDYTAHQVLFQSGKSTLLPAGKKELDKLVAFLEKNPDVKITLEGHTDNTGTDKINQPLSEKRAASSKAYLVSKGIAAERVETAGFGSTKPIDDNKTKTGKANNRRIEVSVM